MCISLLIMYVTTKKLCRPPLPMPDEIYNQANQTNNPNEETKQCFC